MTEGYPSVFLLCTGSSLFDVAVSFKTYLTLIISLHPWEMKFGYWKSYPLGWRRGWREGYFILCRLLVGLIYLTMKIRYLAFLWCSDVLLFGFFHCSVYGYNRVHFLYVQILPLIRKYKVVHLNRTDTRLANNGQPLELQKLRCRVNFSSLKFTPQIEELGRKVIKLLRQKGPFIVLHLRYEMDMLAFSGCTQGCNQEEVDELTRMRWASTYWYSNLISQSAIQGVLILMLLICGYADMLIPGGRRKL